MGNRDRAISRSTVPVDPRPRPATVDEVNTSAATLEIVPLRAIEDGEKFAVVEPVQLPAHGAGPLDEAGVIAEVEQAPAHARFPEGRRRAGEQPVQRVPAHERAVDEQ